ncbi:Lipoprotein OS=Bosea thiooxidans OX=53254 GN=ARD30_13010 PE=4 SV=1 [Bosea thiooxidans]
MTILKPLAAGAMLLALAGCTSVANPRPGTVEYAAATVSRAYDCGLRVDRGGIIAQLDRQDRQRFVEANARFAVKSYKAPHRCDTAERERVQGEIGVLARR